MGLDIDMGLRGASVAAALRLAVARAGLPAARLAESMGWSPSVANRILSNGDYWPSLPTLPRLCGVLEPVALLVLLAVGTAYLIDGSFNPFLYFRF